VAAKDGRFAVDTTRIGPSWDIFRNSDQAFDAFSSREPVSTTLENAIVAAILVCGA
jgi:hypothetical protein